jgi:hypothetical protein
VELIGSETQANLPSLAAGKWRCFVGVSRRNKGNCPAFAPSGRRSSLRRFGPAAAQSPLEEAATPAERPYSFIDKLFHPFILL